LYRKEAWLHELKHSESGREILKTLWRLQQTEANTDSIRQFEKIRKE